MAEIYLLAHNHDDLSTTLPMQLPGRIRKRSFKFAAPGPKPRLSTVRRYSLSPVIPVGY